MKVAPFTLAIMLLFVHGPVSAAEEVFSGPQVGEKLAPLVMTGVYGDDAGKAIDVVTEAEGGPVLVIVLHERTRPAFGLMNAITRYAATRKQDKLMTGVCMLSDDPTATEKWLQNISQHVTKGVKYGISPDGIEGPGSYGLNRNVTLTVLVGRDDKVSANFALVQPSLQADGPKILKEIVAVLGGGEVPDIAAFGPPRDAAMAGMRRDTMMRVRALQDRNASPQELQQAVANLEEYMKDKPAARRFVGQAAKRLVRSGEVDNLAKPVQAAVQRWAKNIQPQARNADARPQDPNLRPLLMPLIQKSATPEEVDAAAKVLEEYMAKNEVARKQVGQIAHRIISAGRLASYGTPRCQHHLQEWAKKYGPSEQSEDAQ